MWHLSPNEKALNRIKKTEPIRNRIKSCFLKQGRLHWRAWHGWTIWDHIPLAQNSSSLKKGQTWGTWTRKHACMKTDQTLGAWTRFMNAGGFLSGKRNPDFSEIDISQKNFRVGISGTVDWVLAHKHYFIFSTVSRKY